MKCNEFCAVLAVLLADGQYRGQRHLLAAPTPPTPPATSNINQAIMLCLPTVLFMLVAVLQACEGLLQFMVPDSCVHAFCTSLHRHFSLFLRALHFFVLPTSTVPVSLSVSSQCMHIRTLLHYLDFWSALLSMQSCCTDCERLLEERISLWSNGSFAFVPFLCSRLSLVHYFTARAACIHANGLQSFTHPSARIHFFRSFIRMRTKACKCCALEAIGTSQVTLFTRMAALASRIWAKS